MPVTNWNTAVIDGANYLIVDLAKLRIPLDWDANGNVFLAVSAPDGIDGDALFSYPALVKGDQGDTPTLDQVVDLTVLEYTDPTPDSASLVPISPGVYQLQTTQRKGPKGDTGSVVLHLADDLTGSLTPGSTLIVNSAGNGFVVAGIKVGDWYIGNPVDTPTGNPSYTNCVVPVPAQTFDWRPHCDGYTIADAGLGIDCITDYVARLNVGTGPLNTSGNELARCVGLTFKERLILSGGPPSGSADAWDRVPAGQPANILFRVERTAGWDTATTSHTTTRCRVKVDPVP